MLKRSRVWLKWWFCTKFLRSIEWCLVCITTINRFNWNENRAILWKWTILLNFCLDQQREPVFLSLPATTTTAIKINAADKPPTINHCYAVFNVCHTIYSVRVDITMCTLHKSNMWTGEGAKKRQRNKNATCLQTCWYFLMNNNNNKWCEACCAVSFWILNIRIRILLLRFLVRLRYEWEKCMHAGKDGDVACLKRRLMSAHNINENGGEYGGEHIKDRKWSVCTSAQRSPAL